MKKVLTIMIMFYLSIIFNCHSYVEKEKVIEAFIQHQQKNFEIKSDAPSEMEKEIVKNLIPLDEMFPPQIKEELDKEKQEYLKKNETILLEKSNNKITGVDLRKFDTPVKNQWNGTCTTFGLIAAMENVLKGKIHLSERFFWSLYGEYSSAIAVTTAEKFSTCEEKYWPQSYTSYNSQDCKQNAIYGLQGPTKYLGYNIDEMIKFLNTEKPLYLAMSTPKEMASCNKFISDKSGKTNGGHALSIVGYQLDQRLNSGGYFILKNSWSDRCGDRGYQYLDFGFCLAKNRYCRTWGIDNVVKKDPLSDKKCLKYGRENWWEIWKKKKCLKWS